VTTVQEMAAVLDQEPDEVLSVLQQLNDQHKYESELDLVSPEDAELLVLEAGHTPKRVVFDFKDAVPSMMELDEALHSHRQPVISVMGHVDHGKTTLLDSLRDSTLADNEAGGITQRIGAFNVMHDEQSLTFFDTPGHESFGCMRSSTIQLTDVAVLCVAADDGPKPQTLECIHLIQRAGVQLVVALTKCDRPDADPARVKQQLMQHGVISDDLGGDAIFVEVSAVKKEGMDTLVEAIMLQSELLELKAPTECSVEGSVVDAWLNKNTGHSSSVLVRSGKLQPGDVIVAGTAWARVRAMNNDLGATVKDCMPGVVVETTGWKNAPQVGDMVLQVKNEARAKQVVEGRMERQEALRQHAMAVAARRVSKPGLVPLKVILKAASIGQMHALNAQLSALVNDEVGVHTISAGVGNVSKYDVDMAAATGAMIIGFGINVPGSVMKQAELQSIDIYREKVVYHVVDHAKMLLGKLLPLAVKYDLQGSADVLQVFPIKGKKRNSPIINAAGCKVSSGTLSTEHVFRVYRNDDTDSEDMGLVEDEIEAATHLFEGKALELRHFRDAIETIKSGHECGIQLTHWQDYEIGDKIQSYVKYHVPRKFEMESDE